VKTSLSLRFNDRHILVETAIHEKAETAVIKLLISNCASTINMRSFWCAARPHQRDHLGRWYDLWCRDIVHESRIRNCSWVQPLETHGLSVWQIQIRNE
jgi:hypothetical protein